MIISNNNTAKINAFKQLLSATTAQLGNNAQKSPSKILALTGSKIENYIKDVMSELAVNTEFADSIELISGHKFPDIIAANYFGVEIKTSSQNHFKTTGNSITETTRIAGIERIFLLFAKLNAPIEFKVRPYEDVLSGVVVTHSPRYLIDMDLPPKQTIFHRLGTTYDEFRKQQNPIKTIIKHYKKTLKEGEQLWWMGANETPSPNLVIRMWHNLPKQEAQTLKNAAMAFFPEIFSKSPAKFGRFALWLTTQKSIICPNIRDLFTSGGKCDLTIGTKTYPQIPRIALNLYANYADIVAQIEQTAALELERFWQTSVNEANKIKIWLELISQNLEQILDDKNLNLLQTLKNLA